jgi:hypothetical protein
MRFVTIRETARNAAIFNAMVFIDEKVYDLLTGHLHGDAETASHL